MRDCLLTASGELNSEMGGPGFSVFESRGGLNGFPPITNFGRDGLRRMVYVHKVRMERDAVFGAFDCPDAGQSCPKRSRSTTALQALNLFNSPFILARAEQFAQRIEHRFPSDRDSQITDAFQTVLSRSPREEELSSVRGFVEQYGLPALGRALFNTNEFLMIP